MRVRVKKSGALGTASKFNTHTLAEVIVGFDEGDMDSMYIRELDVYLEPSAAGDDGGWLDMREAFRKRNIIPNNLNNRFGVPQDAECRARGYNP